MTEKINQGERSNRTKQNTTVPGQRQQQSIVIRQQTLEGWEEEKEGTVLCGLLGFFSKFLITKDCHTLL